MQALGHVSGRDTPTNASSWLYVTIHYAAYRGIWATEQGRE